MNIVARRCNISSIAGPDCTRPRALSCIQRQEWMLGVKRSQFKVHLGSYMQKQHFWHCQVSCCVRQRRANQHIDALILEYQFLNDTNDILNDVICWIANSPLLDVRSLNEMSHGSRAYIQRTYLLYTTTGRSGTNRLRTILIIVGPSLLSSFKTRQLKLGADVFSCCCCFFFARLSGDATACL